MPRFRAPAKDEALLLRERGLDPAKVLIDLDSGHLYDADRVAPPSLGEKVTSGLRSVTGGLLQTAPALTSLVGAGVESLTGYKGVSDAADAMEQGIQKSAGADPRVSNWINVPGQTIGQIGSAMLGVGGASKLLSLGKAGSAVLGPAIGTAMTAGDTVSEELDRQARDEEQRSAGKALIKGLGVGAASYPLERFGLGRIFDEAENIAAKPLMNRLLSLGTKGAAGEAAEEGIQYGTVEGSNTDPAKLAERMAAGAIGGGVGGALVGGAQTPPSKPVVEEGVDKAKEMAAGKKTPTYNGPSDVMLDAMEASIRKGHKYDPVGLKTPVDAVFEELRAAQVPMLRDDIRRLFDIWGGSPANVPKVKQAAREMHDSWVLNRPARAMKAPEAVKKERADLDALDSEIKTVNGRYEKLQAAAQKDAEKANEAPAGTRWEILNNENAQLRTAEMQQLEEQLNQLVQQKKLLFSQMADPTDSSRRPVAEGDTMRKPMSAEEAAAAELRRVQGLPSVGGGELPGAPGGLEGAPIETGEVQIPSGAPVVGPEQAALLEQQRLEQEAASAPAREAAQAALEQARINYERLLTAREQLTADPRRESPVQGIRQPVEDELEAIERELAAEQTEVLKYKKLVGPSRTEVDKFLRGETLPGMEGEQGVPFDVQPSAVSGNKAAVAPVAPVKDNARWTLRDDLKGEMDAAMARLNGQYTYEFKDVPENSDFLEVFIDTKDGKPVGQIWFRTESDQIVPEFWDFDPAHEKNFTSLANERINRSETGLLKTAAKYKGNPASEVAFEYNQDGGPLGSIRAGLKPTDYLRKAYKRVAEMRQDYKRTKVAANLKNKNQAVAGFYDPVKDEIHSGENDRETALHESIHRTNVRMSAAVLDQIKIKLKENPFEVLNAAGRMVRSLREISPLYDKHERRWLKALDSHAEKSSDSQIAWDLFPIFDEALAQSVASDVDEMSSRQQYELGSELTGVGFPVREFSHALRSEAGRPRWDRGSKTYYSGVPLDVVGKNLRILGGKLGQYFQDHPHNGPLALLYDRTRSVRSRLAGAGPLGAYVAARMDPMWKRLTQIENSKLTQADQFRELVSHDSVIDWLFDSLDNQTEDYSKLPEKYRTEARQLMEFSKSFITDMQERGQFVRTGNTEPRLPEVIEGYLPTAVDQKVWEEIGTPEGYNKWEKIWVDNWARYRPQDSESQARELFRDFTSPISSVHAVGGEPLFMAARRAHGVPLPREMRDRDIMRGIQQYIGNFSADAVWTEFMQKDPLMRRAFGIKLDHQFVDHSAEDLDVEPVEEQWAQIIREGKRVNAPWVNELTPGMPLGSPMLVRSEHGVAEAFLASLTETPTHRMTAAMKQFNNIGQIASSLLMQTATGIRDVAMGVSELAAYVPSTKLLGQFADVVMDYGKYRDQARADGALKNDVYRHQAANIVSKAAYDTSRALRTVTARNFLDEFPRVFIHHAVKETVMQDFRTAGRSPLSEEFGALEGTPEERAESTSAAVVNRIAPNYDARSLPKDWIPQTRSLIGYLTQLSTWGVARYNTWYEDHYLPAMKSKNPNRLFRSLLFGTIGGAAANALIDELFKKKPSKLTWQEWMGLSSEKQIEEAAPLLFGIIQTQGLLGTAGDLALPMVQLGNRLATGKGPSVNVPDLGDATIPALLVAQDFLMTSADFISYASSKKWNIDWKDIVDLGNEYAKSAQTWRDMQGWFATNEKDVDREKNLYERMSGTSATTGEKIQSPLFAQPQTRLGSKFNLSKAFNSRTGADLTSLVPGLAAAAEDGYVPNLKNRDLRTDFWRDVVSRRGFDTAKEMAKKLEEQQKEEPRRRQIRAALRSLAD